MKIKVVKNKIPPPLIRNHGKTKGGVFPRNCLEIEPNYLQSGGIQGFDLILQQTTIKAGNKVTKTMISFVLSRFVSGIDRILFPAVQRLFCSKLLLE